MGWNLIGQGYIIHHGFQTILCKAYCRSMFHWSNILYNYLVGKIASKPRQTKNIPEFYNTKKLKKFLTEFKCKYFCSEVQKPKFYPYPDFISHFLHTQKKYFIFLITVTLHCTDTISSIPILTFFFSVT